MDQKGGERERRKIRKGKDWLEERRPPARSAPHHAAAGEGHRKWMDEGPVTSQPGASFWC